jgi:hypothetical protein
MIDIVERVDALLMDGRIVHVRSVTNQDKEALTALYTRASPRSRYRVSSLLASQSTLKCSGSLHQVMIM